MAARFRQRYRPEQWAIYVNLFFENTLTMIIDPAIKAHGVPARMGNMLAFVDTCLASAAPQTDERSTPRERRADDTRSRVAQPKTEL